MIRLCYVLFEYIFFFCRETRGLLAKEDGVSEITSFKDLKIHSTDEKILTF